MIANEGKPWDKILQGRKADWGGIIGYGWGL